MSESKGITVEKEENALVAEKPVTILVAGVESINDEIGRSDSIALLTWKPQERVLSVRSLCRDMYVEIPGYQNNKLNAAYHLGGLELLKKTVTENFGISIDYGVSVDFEQFQHIIDLLGGVTVDITKEEAEYLNSTNYISNKKNRTLVEDKIILNGNQALGYA